MKHGALPPLHLRPNDGWERRTAEYLLYHIIDVSRHPQQPVEPAVTDFRRASNATPAWNYIFLLSAELAATFI